MNPIELYHKDGRSAGVWYCAYCRLTFSHREPAEQCCEHRNCSVCGKPCEKMFYTICDSCSKAAGVAKEQELFEKAEKLATWDGWVYVEGMGFQDGFFLSVEELEEHCSDEGVDLPRYAWTWSSKRLIELDIDDILEDILSGDSAPSSVDGIGFDGLKEIRKAIEAFNKANSHLITYDPDFTQCVLLNRKTKHPNEN